MNNKNATYPDLRVSQKEYFFSIEVKCKYKSVSKVNLNLE